MKTIIKWLAPLALVFAIQSFSYASATSVNDGGKLKKGEMVDLATQHIVWEKGDTVVIERAGRNYFVQKDDEGRGVVVRKIGNLANFVADNEEYYTRMVPVYGFGYSWYHPYWHKTIVVKVPYVVRGHALKPRS